MENKEFQTQPLKLLPQRQILYPLNTLSESSLMEKGSLFQYNTTIVDLNPFERKENPSDVYNRSQQAPFSGDARFRTENNVLFNKIVNQKKFLINKNIRFYEPVRDAKERHQIMAKFDTLRSKLANSQTKNYTPPPLHRDEINRKTGAIDKDDYYMLKPEDLIESFKHLHSHSMNSENGNERHDDKTGFKSSSFEEKFIPIKVINTKKNKEKESILEMPPKGVHSAKAGNKVASQNDSRSTHYTDLTDTQPHHEQEQQKTTPQNLEKSASPNRYEDFSELKRFSRYHTNLTRKSFQKSSADYKKAKKYQVNNDITNSNPVDPFAGYNAETLFNSADNLKGILVSNPLSKRINHVVRKSSKNRLENIYKADNTKNVAKKSNENIALASSSNHAISVHNSNNIKAEATTLLHTHTNNLLFQKSMHFVDNHDSLLLCDDPTCEYKVFSKAINLQNVQNKNKKELPNERYQRIKKAEVQTIENIIGDIPSTLHTMKTIGRVTNVEKLITNALSDFYTYKSSRLVN